MEDQKIVDLFFERSEQAISELIASYGTTVRRIAANILDDALDVEECVSDTYLQIWNAIPPQQPRSLKAFCCSVARNTALTRFRANTAQKRNSRYNVALEELEECIPAPCTMELEIEAKELSACINQFLDNLCYDDRFAFVQRYYFGDSIADIASAMNLTPHRVSVRLFRIRVKLQKTLQKEGLIV